MYTICTNSCNYTCLHLIPHTLPRRKWQTQCGTACSSSLVKHLHCMFQYQSPHPTPPPPPESIPTVKQMEFISYCHSHNTALPNNSYTQECWVVCTYLCMKLCMWFCASFHLSSHSMYIYTIEVKYFCIDLNYIWFSWSAHGIIWTNIPYRSRLQNFWVLNLQSSYTWNVKEPWTFRVWECSRTNTTAWYTRKQ